MTSIKQFRREENIIIPSKNFITTLLNISEDSLEECVVRQDNKTNTLIYEVKLKKMTECCPYCGGDIVGYGYVHKRINHPALRQFIAAEGIYARYVLRPVLIRIHSHLKILTHHI